MVTAKGLQRPTDTREQQSLARFVHHVRRVVAGAAVHTQTHGHTGVEHLADGGDAAGQPHVAAGAVGYAGAGGGVEADAFVVEFDAVGVPHIVAQPAQVLCVFGRGAVEFFAAVGDVVVVLGQVGVQAHALTLERTGQRGRFAHQVAAHAERRAGRHGHVDHRPVGCVVVLLDQTPGVLQDEVFALHHPVGWQAALRLAHTHTAACRHKTHADLLCGFDAVVQPHAVGVDVQVVAAGGAARQQQLGHGNLGGHLHHLRREPGPDRVQPAQPREQLGILHLGNGSGERLVHVVVGVHQAGHYQMPTGVDHLVSLLQCRWQCGRVADPFDEAVPHEQAGVGQFGGWGRAGGVQGGDTGSVVDEQGGHGVSCSQ